MGLRLISEHKILKNMKAIIVGATGATGKDLLAQILEDDAFAEVHIFVRKAVKTEHSKLTIHIIDFEKPENWKHLVVGDVLFSCLGTTLKAAGSKEAQWKIDYTYQYEFAKAAKENGIKHYILVSSMGANSQSKLFYIKMKGALEDAVNQLSFPRLSIFKPPILIRKDSDRAGENIGVKLLQFLNKFGLFASQKPLLTEHLAQAMLIVAKKPTDTVLFTSREIRNLVEGRRL